tara:strand:- start:1737 stop:2312 length:576 start_codon:yes stop_codon:yes gene_type:complete
MAIQINGNGTITGISSGGLPAGTITSATLASGAITSAAMPAGSVIQIQHASTTTEVDHNSGSNIFTGLTDDITPSSTSSNVFVSAVIHWDLYTGGTGQDCGLGFKLTRTVGGTETTLYESDDPYDVYAYINSGLIENRSHKTIEFLDTGISTTSAATYKVYARAYNVSGATHIKTQSAGGKSTITLMEIAA